MRLKPLFLLNILFTTAISTLFLFTGYIYSNFYLTSLIGCVYILVLAEAHVSSKLNLAETESNDKVAALIPAYKEGDKLKNSINSLKSASHQNLQIKIICEEGDSETISRAKKHEDNRTKVLINNSDKESKASALNYGIRNSSAPYIAIFDSDQIIPENFFKRGLPYLDRHNAYQARVISPPTNLISKICYYEELFHTDGAKNFFYKLTGRFQPRTKAVIFERECLAQLNGFNENVLTEDTEFGERFVRNNYIAYKDYRNKPVFESSPTTFRDWLGHRIRWTTGFLETFMLNSQESDLKNKLGFSGAFVALSLLIFMLGQFFSLLINQSSLHIITPVITTALVSLTIKYKDYNEENIDRVGFDWIFSAFVFPLIAVIMLYSMIKKFLKIETKWYRINKSPDHYNLD